MVGGDIKRAWSQKQRLIYEITKQILVVEPGLNQNKHNKTTQLDCIKVVNSCLPQVPQSASLHWTPSLDQECTARTVLLCTYALSNMMKLASAWYDISDHNLSCREKTYTHLSYVEIYEFRRFVSDEATEVASNENVPSGRKLCLNFSFDCRSYFLFCGVVIYRVLLSWMHRVHGDVKESCEDGLAK